MKDELINMVMSKLRLIFGKDGKPGMNYDDFPNLHFQISGKRVMRDIAVAMAFSYPAMFRCRSGSDSMREVEKIDIQAGKMCDRVC